MDCNLIKSYLNAIDRKNKEKIKILYNENFKNNIENDIAYEMYNENKLNCERLQFIINNCTAYFNISFSLINKLMKDNNIELLEILFKNHLKFFDNDFIINILNYYKNKIPISNSDLYNKINNDKYKISTILNRDYYYDSSSYLFNACESGNEVAVKFLLEHDADIMIKDNKNNITLSKACESGNLHLVKYLVHLGVDVNNENDLGVTHIFNACSSGNLNLVKYLMEHGEDINKESNDGKTPLFYACKKGHENIVKYLKGVGTDIYKESNNGTTTLMKACCSENLNLVKYLVGQGLNIEEENNNGFTPLLYACQNI